MSAAIIDQDVAVRLEVLKLAYRFDLAPRAIVERAAELEKYVTRGAPTQGRKADKGATPAET